MVSRSKHSKFLSLIRNFTLPALLEINTPTYAWSLLKCLDLMFKKSSSQKAPTRKRTSSRDQATLLACCLCLKLMELSLLLLSLSRDSLLSLEMLNTFWELTPSRWHQSTNGLPGLPPSSDPVSLLSLTLLLDKLSLTRLSSPSSTTWW